MSEEKQTELTVNSPTMQVSDRDREGNRKLNCNGACRMHADGACQYAVDIFCKVTGLLSLCGFGQGLRENGPIAGVDKVEPPSASRLPAQMAKDISGAQRSRLFEV